MYIFFFLAPSESAVKKRIRTLGYLHVFLPNIMMFVAFVLWGVTEGESFKSINHTVKKTNIILMSQINFKFRHSAVR